MSRVLGLGPKQKAAAPQPKAGSSKPAAFKLAQSAQPQTSAPSKPQKPAEVCPALLIQARSFHQDMKFLHTARVLHHK